MTRDKKCMEHTWTYSPMNELFDRCRWCGETRASVSKAPSSPVETTAGSARPIPREGSERLTGDREARYLEAMGASTFVHRNEAVPRVTALADAEHAALAAEVARLRRVISTVLDTTDAHLGAKDAIIERLWRQLEEATNVPLILHEPGCSLDTDHKGSCVLGERISGVDECPCSRCAHYRDVAASIAAKATP